MIKVMIYRRSTPCDATYEADFGIFDNELCVLRTAIKSDIIIVFSSPNCL